MHIEAGVVEAGKLVLSYATAAGALAFVAKLAFDHLKTDGFISLIVKSILASLSVFVFFEVFPHHPIGISEVHLIMGSTLFLLFGIAPTAVGLALGLLAQGMFFAPADLPQYFINVSTLIYPLLAIGYLAKYIIAPNTPYKNLTYAQALKLSTTYQGGIVAWVAFWAFYGQGFGAENLAGVGSFSIAYLTVIILEPLVDLAVLALAKILHGLQGTPFVSQRIYIANEPA